MSSRWYLFRRAVAILTIAAHLAMAGLMPAMAQMAAGPESGAMHYAASKMDVPQPCTELGPGCFTEAGCVFLTGAPARPLGFNHPATSSPVGFCSATPVLHGRTLQPALDPPIAQA